MPERTWFLVDSRTGRVVSHLVTATEPAQGSWPAHYVPELDPPAADLAVYRAWLGS